MTQMNRIGTINTTKGMQDDGFFTVTYHNTAVVKFNHDTIILNTDGWFTPSTKVRMNQASNEFDLGFKVFQSKGKWFVGFDGEKSIPFNEDGTICLKR